jgi:hypothetical protein
MRVQAFADVINGLSQRSAVVLIVGLGGQPGSRGRGAMSSEEQ